MSSFNDAVNGLMERFSLQNLGDQFQGIGGTLKETGIQTWNAAPEATIVSGVVAVLFLAFMWVWGGRRKKAIRTLKKTNRELKAAENNRADEIGRLVEQKDAAERYAQQFHTKEQRMNADHNKKVMQLNAEIDKLRIDNQVAGYAAEKGAGATTQVPVQRMDQADFAELNDAVNEVISRGHGGASRATRALSMIKTKYVN